MNKPKPKPRGRPTAYTPALARQICERMAAGETLNKICADQKMPAESTVRLWALDDRDGFSAMYTRARELLCAFWADEVIAIADSTEEGHESVTKADGSVETRSGDMLHHRRLKIEARKWLLSKLTPRQFGDKVELSGSKDAPVTVEIVRFTKPE